MADLRRKPASTSPKLRVCLAIGDSYLADRIAWVLGRRVSITVASTGAAAMAACRKKPMDAIFIDPNSLTDFAALNVLRMERPELATIVCTSDSALAMRGEALFDPSIGFLGKDFALIQAAGTLMDRVRERIRASRTRRRAVVTP